MRLMAASAPELAAPGRGTKRLAMRALAVLGLATLLMGAPVTLAKPPTRPASIEAAVRAAERAIAANDETTLAHLAAFRAPDPWRVVQQLLHEGNVSAARAFSKLVPEARRGTLPEQVDAWAKRPEAKTVVETFARLNRLLQQKQPAKVRTLADATQATHPISTIMIRTAVGSALWMEQSYAACQAYQGETARKAHSLGWLAAATAQAGGAAAAAYRLKDFEASLDFRQRAWDAGQEGTPINRHPYLLRALGEIHGRAGRLAKALTISRDALRRSEALKSAVDVIRSAALVGQYARITGKLKQSRAAYERVLALSRARKDPRMEIRTIVNLCAVLRDLGALTEALALLEGAWKLAEKSGTDGQRADVLRRFASVYERQGKLALAVRAYRRSLAISRKRGDQRRIAWALHGLGGAQTALGDFAGAVKSLEESIEIKTVLKDASGAARSLSLLGNAHMSAGRLDAARSAMDLSLSVKRRRGELHSLSSGLVNRAHLFVKTGDLAAARKDLEEALVLKRKTNDLAGEGIALSLLGQVEYESKAYDKAQAVLEKALALSERTGGAIVSVSTRTTLARTLLRLKQPKAALVHIRKGFEDRERVLAGLDDAHAIFQQTQFELLVGVGLEAADALKDAATGFAFLERGRATALLSALGGRDALGEHAMPETLRDAERTARLAEHRALQELTLALANNDDAGILKARAAVDAARAVLRETIEMIRAQAKPTADVVFPLAVTLQELQAALAPGAQYVAFHMGSTQGYAIVVSKQSARMVRLPRSAAIEETVSSVRFDAPPVLHAKGLEALRAQVIAPLGIGTEGNLLLSPDGVLARVPFAALLPNRALTYVPSSTVWSALREGCTRCGEGILALGDPAYARGATFGGVPLKRLPLTRDEAQQIGTNVLLGSNATEPALYAGLRARKQWRALHLACHGLMNPQSSSASALALAPAAGSDGRLTVREVLRMRVPADLVTLSACETGVGKIQSGAGIVGFARAFMFAGAPRVLVSQWMVEDEATRALMTKFYALWQEKREDGFRDTAASLREAQAWMRTQTRWAHPYYWAGWSLWGVGE